MIKYQVTHKDEPNMLLEIGSKADCDKFIDAYISAFDDVKRQDMIVTAFEVLDTH